MTAKPPFELVWIMPGDAQLNPDNWRRHPEEQLAGLDELIFGETGVGWAGAIIINDRQVEDGWLPVDAIPTIVNGAARETIATEHNAEMPALIGRWNPHQEAMILATLDPLALMAEYDQAKLTDLLQRVSTDAEAVMKVVENAATEAGLYKEWIQGLGSPSKSDRSNQYDEDFDEEGEDYDDGLIDLTGGARATTALNSCSVTIKITKIACMQKGSIALKESEKTWAIPSCLR